jgi:hypothetical protein
MYVCVGWCMWAPAGGGGGLQGRVDALVLVVMGRTTLASRDTCGQTWEHKARRASLSGPGHWTPPGRGVRRISLVRLCLGPPAVKVA